MSKYTLKLTQGFPFATCPISAELDAEKILCNDVMLPADFDEGSRYNPHNIGLYVIGHEFGPICAVWAGNDQDALDNAVDANMLDCLLVEGDDADNEGHAGLGNAGEPFDLSYAWMARVEWDATRDIQLIVKFARAAESGSDTLDF